MAPHSPARQKQSASCRECGCPSPITMPEMPLAPISGFVLALVCLLLGLAVCPRHQRNGKEVCQLAYSGLQASAFELDRSVCGLACHATYRPGGASLSHDALGRASCLVMQSYASSKRRSRTYNFHRHFAHMAPCLAFRWIPITGPFQEIDSHFAVF